jgi:delta 1-pyrroline-5-carboxylate dehydrogenase
MSTTRIYLSGPMTGLPEWNFPAFHEAAAALRALGYEVVSPAELNADTSVTWHQALRADIKALCDCDAIALLPGWERSNGAHLELHLAHRLGIDVLHVPELLRANRPTASAHLLRQMQRDGRLAYLIGPGSQSYELLTTEVALANKRDIREFRDEFGPSLHPVQWTSEGDIEDRIIDAIQADRKTRAAA